MSYLLAFLGIAALIVLHEAGHFTAAKAVGMRVERFSLFFGPMLLKVRRGETEYGIGAIPLGGYVKITGMNPHEESREAMHSMRQGNGCSATWMTSRPPRPTTLGARTIWRPRKGSCGRRLPNSRARWRKSTSAPTTTSRCGSGSS